MPMLAFGRPRAALVVSVLSLLALLGLSCARPAQAATRAAVQRTLNGYARAYVTRYADRAQAAGMAIPPDATDCTGPASDPAPGSAQWYERDALNQFCATARMQEEYSNPAFFAVFWTQTPALYAEQNLNMVANPLHPHLSLGQLVAGGSTTDPFRTITRWADSRRGRVYPVSFPATDGATLNGYLFEPPADGRDPYTHNRLKPPFPGVVITTGSIQAYQQMYFWAAEGLAEAGYQVLTYDVQGQGNSDTFPATSNCSGPSACEGVPFQQSYNFYQGAEDALNYFLSTPAHPYSSPAVAGSRTFNPRWHDLDADAVGIAGHSLGAAAVSTDGQCDPRVKAIVAWDDLATTTGTCRQNIPSGLPGDAPVNPTLKTPALGFNSEYFLNPEPMSAPPDPQSKAAAYLQLAHAGTDAMQIALRSSMHLEYSYVPYILPASEYGERVAFYYTLAWFDYYLRHMRSGYTRLIATRFDNSSDAHSIGGGLYDPAAAAADPGNPAAGNAPIEIKGLSVADRLSFYYDSEYSLTPPDGGARLACLDMRAGCPTKMPQYP
jgi:dienelactone hydrolase